MKVFASSGLTAALIASAAACTSPEPSEGSGQVGLAHVHGIAVDPGDGTVYAGTHHGLFRIQDGRAERVGDRGHDVMGLAVAGAGHLLASGHPAEGEAGPSSVGLIESTDGGQTWKTLSLAGEADFHALQFQHDSVYGLDAATGQLLVSTDRTSWSTLGRHSIADFAVSPADPDSVVATTQAGIATSEDGGRTFEVMAGGPLLLFVDWADGGLLAGVTPDGVVYTTDDPNGAWSRRGSIGGQPEAFTATEGDTVYAATNGDVLVSKDGARSFTSLLD